LPEALYSPMRIRIRVVSARATIERSSEGYLKVRAKGTFECSKEDRRMFEVNKNYN